MVPGRFEWILQTMKDTLSIMFDQACLTMPERFGPFDPATERVDDPLMPRHTPRIGIFPLASRRILVQAPKYFGSAGVPGPGEIMILSGDSSRTLDTLILSFLLTTTSSATSPTYWARLYTKLS